MKPLFLSLLALIFATSLLTAQSKMEIEAINQTVTQMGTGRGYTSEQQEQIIELLKSRVHDSDSIRRKKLPRVQQDSLIAIIHKERATQINEILGNDTEAKAIYNKFTQTYRAMKKNN